MAQIFSLRPSEHDTVRQLLPWHVNGTLSADETARVDAHIAECAECRDDLAAERELAREIALLPLDVTRAGKRWRCASAISEQATTMAARRCCADRCRHDGRSVVR
ncbi:MAG: zf-HC2 domain-containing protein, partial [Porphyrobacter sp.]|nr:zf-HC2 domain-containing protein [Porphyrobacter sp.]